MALHLPIKLLCAGAALCFVLDGVVLLPDDLARLVAAKPLAAGSGGGANNPDLSVADRRHLALQEKNRRAQRRFRERQKAKITELHKQIDDLTNKVPGP